MAIRDVIKVPNPMLAQKSEEVKIIDKSVKRLVKDMFETMKKNDGIGLAAVQIGVLKRIIVIVHEYADGKFNNYVVVNPKIISHSEEMVALDTGEGCLSVNREVDGHVPRYARATISGFTPDGEKIKIRAREELSVAFQHEIDHLNGILFYDRINKKKPFFSEDEIRLI